LKQASEDTAALIVDLQAKDKIAEEKRKEVEAEAEACAVVEQEATAMKADCEEALKKVIPIKKKAIDAVKNLKRDDLDMLKKVKAPTAGFLAVAKGMCIMFKVPG